VHGVLREGQGREVLKVTALGSRHQRGAGTKTFRQSHRRVAPSNSPFNKAIPGANAKLAVGRKKDSMHRDAIADSPIGDIFADGGNLSGDFNPPGVRGS